MSVSRRSGLRFDEPCWVVLGRIVSAVKFAHSLHPFAPLTTEGKKNFLLKSFESSCGYSNEVRLSIFSKTSKKHREYLESACHVSFGNGSQGYEYKEITLKLTGESTSHVPLVDSSVVQPAGSTSTIAMSATTTTSTSISTSVTASAPGSSTSTTATTITNTTTANNAVSSSAALAEAVVKAYLAKQNNSTALQISATHSNNTHAQENSERYLRERVQWYFKTSAAVAVEKMMQETVRFAQKMQHDPRIFLQGIYTKIMQQIRIFHYENVAPQSTASIDRKIVDSLRDTLSLFDIHGGTRPGDEQQLVVTILTCVLGDATQRTAMMQRLGVAGWRRSVESAVRRLGMVEERVTQGEAEKSAFSAVLQKELRNQRSDRVALTFAMWYWHDQCRH